MKKTLLSIALMFITLTSFAGAPISAIPNGGFEYWTIKNFEYPTNYPYNSNNDNPGRYPNEANPFLVSKTTDAYHGNYALRLETRLMEGTETAFAYFANMRADGEPDTWKGGHAISGKPTGVRLHYKYNVASGDSGLIIMNFTKAGTSVGMVAFLMGGEQTSYTLFEKNFNLSDTPDSVAFAMASSNAMNESGAVIGATLIVDSIALLGITNQPTLFNGDFENWENGSVDLVNQWYADDKGVSLTTDKYAGNYAIELKTREGERNGVARANASQVSTGYYPNNCDGDCQELGGYPYTLLKDTLCFYYKYAPSGADTASVNINFKKNGVRIGNIGGGGLMLASSNFQLKEIPFDFSYSFETPDSVIISFQSSLWSDSALTFVGSTLIIDEVYFKSERATQNFFSPRKSTNFTISPNPANDFVLLGVTEAVEVKIINLAGQTVKTSYLPTNELLDVTDLPNGNYLIQINSRKYNGTQKLFINK